METEKKLTGYPSIDRPWLKYYSEEAINTPLPDGTLYQYLYENNKNNLEKIALNYFGKRITYKSLFNNIDKVAKSFIKLGVKKGDIVTIIMLNQPEAVYCAYALNKIGAIINYVTVLASQNELSDYINDAKSNVVVILDLFAEKLAKAIINTSCKNVISVSLSESMPFITKTIFNLKANIKQQKNFITWSDFISVSANIKNVPVSEHDPNSFTFLAHTGGTTGLPKAVMLSDLAINGVASEYDKMFHTESGDKFLNTVVPFVVYGFAVNIHMPLCLGLEDVLLPKSDTKTLVNAFKKYKPNYIGSAPMYLESILKLPKNMDLSFIKMLGSGGDGMTDELETALNERVRRGGSDTKIINGYGLSETCSAACTNQPNIIKKNSVGIPLSNNVMSAFDTETGDEVKCGEIGEICINTPYLMLGYKDNTDETNKIIHTHMDGKKWLHTGDLGYIDEDGAVFIVGRMKRIILTVHDDVPGKIFPSNVEFEINKHKSVENVCVVPMNSTDIDIKLIAFVVIKDNAKLQLSNIKQELIQMCSERLPEYSRPCDYEFIDELPLTASGKVDYRALEKMAEEKIKGN